MNVKEKRVGLLYDDGNEVIKIKEEYLIADHIPELALECIPTKDVSQLENVSDNQSNNDYKFDKRKKKNIFKGQNKKRGPTFVQDKETALCSSLIDIGVVEKNDPTCNYENCKHIHDIAEYMKTKPVDIADSCYVFNIQGHCPRGVTCRFAKCHITETGRNIKNLETMEIYNSKGFSNSLSKDLQRTLRKKSYDFNKSDAIIAEYDKCKNKAVEVSSMTENMLNNSSTLENGCNKKIGFVEDCDIVPLRKRERRTIDWSNKLYLAPLTTVGNLPFRRICKEFGADITCGEMTMAVSLLQGLQQEWALVRRHHTEDIFGTQICGNNPYTMVKCAQLLQEQTDVDFIDINLGCPIENVYQMGAGSGLLLRRKMLETILHNMNTVMDIPLTVKCRAGVHKDDNIAHKLIPLFTKCGVSQISVHGRTKDQRYTKHANWNYIDECALLAKPTPLLGNGDILSYVDYNFAKENYPNISGIMIGRGALYKPWLFTEIKEQRHWDISSSERMDILKKYVNYGLEHWGSDNKGVENTRRFLLEWLSFLHRYIPVGLLECPPQRINQQPPIYQGRNDLETLFSSGNCKDWIRISELLLGPVPYNFHFLPKHKASSWK